MMSSWQQRFDCVNCGKSVVTEELDARCQGCGSALLIASTVIRGINRSVIESLSPGVWRFRAFLPKVSESSIVSLGEGATPLIPAKRLGSELGFNNLLIKDETRNPTGSFMDRGSTLFVSLATERRIERLSCITTGNLGASLAAYSAKAGIKLKIRIHPNTDHGKLYQMIAYGAEVEILSKMPTREQIFEPNETVLVSAANSFVLEGEKTTIFEIVHDSDWNQPDAIVVPVGTGGHLTMIWRGLLDLQRSGLIGKPECKLIGVQLDASITLSKESSMRRRASELVTELEESEPILKKAAQESIYKSKGKWIEVSGRDSIQGTSLLARTEGIFAEPASASVVPALRMIRESGVLDRNDTVVCVITGAGLKDTRTISKIARTPKHVVTREHLIIKPLQIGETKIRIMRLLEKKAQFGYNVWKSLAVEGRKITTASIYQHLSELEGTALIRRSRVAEARGRERIFYEITKKGIELLKTVGNPKPSDRFSVE
jgi:threonine synthase